MIRNEDIILFTNEYPYGKRETFLETEVPILSLHFNRVIIVPSKLARSKRSTPENVVVDTSIANDYHNRIWLFKCIFTSFLYTTFFKYRRVLKSPKKALYLAKYIRSYTIFTSKLPAILDKYRIAKLYCYWYSITVDALIQFKSTHKVKIICRVHRGDLYNEFSPLGFYPFRDSNIHNIDRIYAISSDGKVYLDNLYDSNNVWVSKLGVSDKKYISGPSAPNTISIVSVSNIIPVKRVHLIAESITLLAIVHPDLKIVWNHFGSGSGEAELLEYLNKNRVPNFEYKLNGFVSNDMIYSFYLNNSIDAFINLSESEGIPVSIMEAVSFGIPILATDVGGVSEIVNDTTGLLINSEANAAGVSQALYKLCQSTLDRSLIKEFWARNYDANLNYSIFCKDLINLK